MKAFAGKSHGWRKKNKRGVSPIIATILLVAITVVLAAVLYVLISGLTHGPGNTPLGTAFGFGTATQRTGTSGTTNYCASGDQCWEIGISSASGGLTAAQLTFAAKTSGGSGIPAAKICIIDLAQTDGVCAFSGSSTYTPFGTTLTTSTTLATTMSVWVDSGVTTASSTVGFATGDTLTAFGSGSFSGSVGPTGLP